jgi:hypothetical protein
METNRETIKGVVLITPWPNRLPVGTRIVVTTPRPEKIKFNGSMWFVREDGKLIFDEETDGKFRLLAGEFKID